MSLSEGLAEARAWGEKQRFSREGALRPLTTLASVCAKQGTPYHEACYDRSNVMVAHHAVEKIYPWQIGLPRVYCGLVQNAHIFGHTFVHIKDGGYIFHCQSFSNTLGSSFDEYCRSQIDTRDELFTEYFEPECIFLGGSWFDPDPNHGVPNFGHFIFEFLSRLAIFDLYSLSPTLPVVVYDNVPDRWLGFLELAGIDANRIVRVSAERPPAFRRVWVSSACHYRDQRNMLRYWDAGLHWMRTKILKSIGGPNLSTRRRVYLGRRDAKWRKVANEPEVIKLLSEYGFESISMADLTASEQVKAVSGAEIIVTAAGASGIMSLFAPEYCTIFFMAPHGVAVGVWGGLGPAVCLKQIFERIDCQAVSSEHSRMNNANINEVADFTVDLNILREKIHAAIQNLEMTQERDAIAL